MRLVIQRVKQAEVKVNGKLTGSIGKGLLVLVGISKEDDGSEIDWLANKTLNLRIFEDEQSKMNLSLCDINGEILLVSQFTLYADCHKGRRPSFEKAAVPPRAEELFNNFVDAVRGKGFDVQTGVFGADMKVSLLNDGPVTIILER